MGKLKSSRSFFFTIPFFRHVQDSLLPCYAFLIAVDSEWGRFPCSNGVYRSIPLYNPSSFLLTRLLDGSHGWPALLLSFTRSESEACSFSRFALFDDFHVMHLIHWDSVEFPSEYDRDGSVYSFTENLL